MTKEYSQTSDECYRICPYCKTKYQPEGSDYSDHVRVEECGSCGKKYHAHDVFTVTHYATPDCELNGQQHIWKHSRVFGTHCVTCGTREEEPK